LTECGRAAVHEKNAREPGGKPETFHDSDELTNFAAAVQQNVRERHRSENRSNPHLLSLAKRTYVDPLEETQFSRTQIAEDFY
jgi:hypothetical protein